MPLQKVPLNINFRKGLDTKTDPNQVELGSFLTLVNSVFTTTGRLTKRNGFPLVTALPNANQTVLTKLNDSLLATGTFLYSYSSETNTWTNKGNVQPVSLSVTPLVRTSSSQSNPDSAVASNGLVCQAYYSSSTPYYRIIDVATGDQIVGETALPSTATSVRVFTVGSFFIITFAATVSGVSHLQYISIPIGTPTSPSSATDISTSIPSLSIAYDGALCTMNNQLYLAWADTGSVINGTYFTSLGACAGSTQLVSSASPTLMSVAVDNSTSTDSLGPSTPLIYVSYYQTSDTRIYAACFNPDLTTQFASTSLINLSTTGTPTQLVSAAAYTSISSGSSVQRSAVTILYEISNTYASPYPNTGVRTDFIREFMVDSSGAPLGGFGYNNGPENVARSVGIASKPIITNNTLYFLASYSDSNSNQKTYFLMDNFGSTYMRLAYGNGGGYYTTQVVPSISSPGNGNLYVSYLYADQLVSANKGTNNPTGTPTAAILSQYGINLAKFSVNSATQYSSEIANTLHLTGGQLWMYDGVTPVEHGFHVWPENVAYTTATTGGSLSKQQYFYSFTYEWTDNAGNLHRSAPSIPLLVDLTGSSTSTNTNTLYVPTLRLTQKTGTNKVRIVGYRWSTGQQVYYQFTSITSPNLNDTTVDFISITDTLADSSILGNPILYTTGGVVEDIAAPASTCSTLFGNRLILVDAEDQNVLWYSKQVIEGVPVEMSDLFTIYVAPTIGAQGSTGPVTAVYPMDDKLIIFKKDAIYYITGTGPDNTGASNDFSNPIFITSSVGCSSPSSIVLMPQGLMFQSDKGIWLLGRDLNTRYIGDRVESSNNSTVKSALLIPGTNQVRFAMDTGVYLVYDYYFDEWGTFTGLNSVSATLYGSKHTYLDHYGNVYQEGAGYLDGSKPVLMSFTTAWAKLADVPLYVGGSPGNLQGYERLYQMLLLGTYITPFKLQLQIAYDYGQPSQSAVITPDNYVPNWGGDNNWGSNQYWGGPGNSFQQRVFPQQQKCQSFQIQVSELYDSSYGVTAGAGLTLSGLNLVVGVKKGYRTQRASRTTGTSS